MLTPPTGRGSRAPTSSGTTPSQLYDLRHKYGNQLLFLLLVQFGVANVVFMIYAFARGWKIPDTVMTAYLASMVVQLIGVVMVITRNLFPSRDSRSE